MRTFEKIYIGKGKQIGDLNIVRVTLRIDELQQLAYDFEGIRYVTFDIAQMLKPDTFGRTHTAYHSKPTNQPETVTDYQEDYNQHAADLKSEILMIDHRDPELEYSDALELAQMIEFGSDHE